MHFLESGRSTNTCSIHYENTWVFTYLPRFPNCTVLLPQSPFFVMDWETPINPIYVMFSRGSVHIQTHTHRHTYRETAPILWPRPLMREVKMSEPYSLLYDAVFELKEAGLSWKLQERVRSWRNQSLPLLDLYSFQSACNLMCLFTPVNVLILCEDENASVNLYSHQTC